MITEIIFIVFAIVYYLFSVFFIATIVEDTNKKYNFLQIIVMVLSTMLIAVVITPIILGIKIGEVIKNKIK